MYDLITPATATTVAVMPRGDVITSIAVTIGHTLLAEVAVLYERLGDTPSSRAAVAGKPDRAVYLASGRYHRLPSCKSAPFPKGHAGERRQCGFDEIVAIAVSPRLSTEFLLIKK